MAYNDSVKEGQGSTPVRIGLSGKMRSGKDTVAEFLVDEFGFQRFAFADRLKELASELFGVRPDVKNRDLLVRLGRKMCDVDREVWVNYVLARIPEEDAVVISDVRFPYEHEALREAGFYLVRIGCPYEQRLERLRRTEGPGGETLMSDTSETALDDCDDWDYILDGGIGLISLLEQAASMATDIGCRGGVDD